MDNVCRTCLRAPANLTPLNADSSLINKIETIASIQMEKSADYPSNICQECIINVNTLYNFRKVIINSDKELKEQNATLQRMKAKPPKKEIRVDNGKNREKNESQSAVFDTEDPGGDSSFTRIPNEEEHNLEETVKQAISVMKEWKCHICDKTFPSRFRLTVHKRTQHMPSGVCNVCGRVVRSDNLKRHIQAHWAQPVDCKDCGKVFKNSESLRGHMLLHKGMIYTCEICGKTSKVKTEYKRHLKTHADPEIGKVMCSICGKRIRDMKKHMHSHTGERPYSCAYCMKGFTSTYSLKVHTRQHTNEKPYGCDYCSMAFPQKVSLVAHIKSKHNVS